MLLGVPLRMKTQAWYNTIWVRSSVYSTTVKRYLISVSTTSSIVAANWKRYHNIARVHITTNNGCTAR